MIVVSLFDESGFMLMPWAEAGHSCYAFDIEGTPGFRNGVHYLRADVTSDVALRFILNLSPDIIFGFPPCTDLAISGARHFNSKAAIDPLFQHRAVRLCKLVPAIADRLGIPWMIENPKGVLSTMYRKPDMWFHPYKFGAYLGKADWYPVYPEYIMPNDAYCKQTGLWFGNGFKAPVKRQVLIDFELQSAQYKLLGGKSAKTKRIRSCTPRGLARAVYESNKNV